MLPEGAASTEATAAAVAADAAVSPPAAAAWPLLPPAAAAEGDKGGLDEKVCGAATLPREGAGFCTGAPPGAAPACRAAVTVPASA